jgi:MFS family permease
MTDIAPKVLSDAERAAIQTRVLRVLTAGQIIGAAALAAAVTVGAFVVQDILGQETAWGGIATATVTIGTAVMAQMLSRLMLRRGRRPGLQSGYFMASIGGIIAALGAQYGQLATFIIGLFFFGSGQASNLLARYAATDLADADHRSRSMSRIVFASTFGAVFGPLLIGPAQTAGQSWFGWEKYTGPWVLSAVILAAAFVSTTIFLRPDPLAVIGGLRTSDSEKLPSISVALQTIVATPQGRLALGAMVVSQVVMVAVMTMTPVHMKLHGHETMSQYVVSLHIAGMFAFSPLVGRFADKHGRQLTILIGAVILVASTVLSAASGDYELILFPALWGLGIGWNFGLIGGSSLLIESVPDDKRVTVQGSADLMMSFCGGLAGLASGFVRRAVGYHMLSTVGTLLAGALLVAAFMLYRSNGQRNQPKDMNYAV